MSEQIGNNQEQGISVEEAEKLKIAFIKDQYKICDELFDLQRVGAEVIYSGQNLDFEAPQGIVFALYHKNTCQLASDIVESDGRRFMLGTKNYDASRPLKVKKIIASPSPDSCCYSISFRSKEQQASVYREVNIPLCDLSDYQFLPEEDN